mmetsp:Transcript_4835/g.12395  ORF Transcript_4835/g.12395 Transcript_4835/m.12395 type:complete len:245 (+) Transcript_4835:1-735(+)
MTPPSKCARRNALEGCANRLDPLRDVHGADQGDGGSSKDGAQPSRESCSRYRREQGDWERHRPRPRRLTSYSLRHWKDGGFRQGHRGRGHGAGGQGHRCRLRPFGRRGAEAALRADQKGAAGGARRCRSQRLFRRQGHHGVRGEEVLGEGRKVVGRGQPGGAQITLRQLPARGPVDARRRDEREPPADRHCKLHRREHLPLRCGLRSGQGGKGQNGKGHGCGSQGPQHRLDIPLARPRHDRVHR